MPAAAVASLAKKARVSVEKAEDAWKKIKKSVVGQKVGGTTISSNEDDWGGKEWGYVMGALKKALKLESAIDKVVNGADPDVSLLSESVGVPFVGQKIRAFLDGESNLRFATEDGVLIDETTDERLNFLCAHVLDSDIKDPKFDILDDFCGNLDDLYKHFGIDEQDRRPRTYKRPRKRRFAARGPAVNPLTGKRKDPRKRAVARRVARKFAAKRKAASKRFARTAKSKQFHKKLGKLAAKGR